MGHSSLTLEERYQFYAMRMAKLPMTTIAREMGRDRSGLYDELKRCASPARYCPEQAQRHRHLASQRSAANCVTHSASVMRQVKARLDQQWSPEQITGRRVLLAQTPICKQTIYNLVKRYGWQGLLRQHQLRRHLKRPARRPWQGSAKSIHARAKEVQDRTEIGHWETDTAVGKRSDVKRIIVSVERQSLYTVLRLLPRVEANLTAGLIKRDLHDSGLPFKSVTSDRGSEFSALGDVLPDHAFACDAYRPNQRGTGENTVGLVRQYRPKGKTMNNLTQKQLRQDQDKLNHRPRKSLGYLTPHEIMFNCLPTVGTRN